MENTGSLSKGHQQLEFTVTGHPAVNIDGYSDRLRPIYISGGKDSKLTRITNGRWA